MKKLLSGSKIQSEDEQVYSELLSDVSQLLEQARHAAAKSINTILTATYWEIGHRIVEYEQAGKDRAQYGEELLIRLSKDLTARFGKGFGLTNLKMIRRFFITYQNRVKGQAASDLLQGKAKIKKSQTVSDLLPVIISPSNKELRKVETASVLSSPTPTLEILQTVSGQFPLPWSHYVRLLSLDEKRRCGVRQR